MWRCADISSHTCGGARFLGADRKSIIPIPDPRFFSLSLSLSQPNITTPLITPAFSAFCRSCGSSCCALRSCRAGNSCHRPFVSGQRRNGCTEPGLAADCPVRYGDNALSSPCYGYFELMKAILVFRDSLPMKSLLPRAPLLPLLLRPSRPSTPRSLLNKVRLLSRSN